MRHYVQSADYLKIDPTAFQIYEDNAGKYRWRLRHRNGNISSSETARTSTARRPTMCSGDV